MKTSLILIVTLLNTFLGYGQVQIISSVDSLRTFEKKHINNSIEHYNIYNIEIASSRSNEKQQTFHLAFDENLQWDLNLVENDSLITNDYQTFETNENGMQLFNKPSVKLYKEAQTDNNIRSARFAVYEDNRIDGVIECDKEKFFIMPVRFLCKESPVDNRIIIFKASDIIEKGSDLGCSDAIEINLDKKENIRSTIIVDNIVRELQIATEADFEFYSLYGTNSNDRILSVLNQAEAVYSNTFNIRFRVNFQHVWSTVDPYGYDFSNEGNASNMLLQFRTYWNQNYGHIQRHLSCLFSSKGGAQINGMSYVASINRDKSIAYCTSRDRVNMFQTTAHEIGHGFSASDNPSDGNCGNFNASVMCQGNKANPMYFSNISKNEIKSHLSQYDLPSRLKYKINGPSIVDLNNTIYQIPDASAKQVTWTTSNDITIITGQGTNQVTVKGYNSGATGYIRASFVDIEGNVTIEKNVHVGGPIVSSIYGPTNVRTNSSITYTANPIFDSNIGNYNWSINPSSGVSIGSYRHQCEVKFSNTGYYTLICRGSLPSGELYGVGSSISISVSQYYNISKDAQSKIIKVEYNMPNDYNTAYVPNGKYYLYNSGTGVLVSEGDIKHNVDYLDFNNITNGIYILKLETNNNMYETHKINL